MEISNVGCRCKLRSLTLQEMGIFYSEIELSADYLRKSDVLWLPQNEESLKENITNMINNQQMMQFPNTLAIINENNIPVGVISCHSFDNRHGVFSYGISLLNNYQNKGYGFEAANLLLLHMFYTRGYFKCIANTYAFNNFSIKLQKKIGFGLEGVLKNAYYSRGEFIDIFIWGIDKNEFLFMHNAQK
jgi:RimJ/RimL family protein N-acetyltransferase